MRGRNCTGRLTLFIISSASIAWRSGIASKSVVSRCHRTWPHRYRATIEAREHDFSSCARFLVRTGFTRFDVCGMGLEKQAMRAKEAEGSSRKKCNRMPSGLPQGSGIQFLSIGGKARCMWSLRAEELLARGGSSPSHVDMGCNAIL